jgi:hypothetical protein
MHMKINRYKHKTQMCNTQGRQRVSFFFFFSYLDHEDEGVERGAADFGRGVQRQALVQAFGDEAEADAGSHAACAASPLLHRVLGGPGLGQEARTPVSVEARLAPPREEQILEVEEEGK